ncbi:MAG: DUF3761 domain-containing protein [Muribaculaceae bacterium]|nr:DUF3761 domain-containing protein [Muribaculaceae bacterium]
MKKLLFLLSVVLTSLVSLAQTPFVTTANLNMRTLPCTCAGVSVTIPKGETIYVLNYEDDSWARVSYNGHVDYVSRKYIVQKTNQPKTYKSPSSTGITSGNSIKYYTNSRGERVQSPTYYQTAPAGATALCRDGTYSFSRSRIGTCSHHGGVAKWL